MLFSRTVLYFRNPSPHSGGDDKEAPIQDQEVSFCIKRALGARKGWKIIADDGHSIDGSALRTVVSMIKDMECQVANKSTPENFKTKNISQGFAVPERISIRIP